MPVVELNSSLSVLLHCVAVRAIKYANRINDKIFALLGAIDIIAKIYHYTALATRIVNRHAKTAMDAKCCQQLIKFCLAGLAVFQIGESRKSVHA